MDERKILFIILSAAIYLIYSVQMWFLKKDSEVAVVIEKSVESIPEVIKTDVLEALEPKIETILKEEIKPEVKRKPVPLFVKDGCSVLQVLTEKPPVKPKIRQPTQRSDNTLTVIGITVFLLILLINAVLDVLKAKEEERIKRKLHPDGERRQSLAEFANNKSLRRESSKFGLQLFQIAESFVSLEDDKKTKRPYTRGDSTNSYLSETKRKSQEGSAPASIAETPAEPRLVKRQSATKLFGARPVPMVRRSSFPALPLNPEVQALMLGHRQASVDSDDEDGKGRRVRLIRRF